MRYTNLRLRLLYFTQLLSSDINRVLFVWKSVDDTHGLNMRPYVLRSIACWVCGSWAY